MIIPFVGGAYTSRSSALNGQTCINFFPVIDTTNSAKAAVALFGTPGLTALCNLVSGTGKVVRAAIVVGEYLYAVVNNTIYKVSDLGVATTLGTISTNSGFVSIADNGTQIIIADNTALVYLVTVATDAVTQVTDIDYAVSSVTFQDGFFIAIKSGTRSFFVSALRDGTSWSAGDTGVIEGRSSNLLSVISNIVDLWFFGNTSIEVYYNSGATFPFERISGALIDVGCGAIGSPCKIDGRMYWLTDIGRVARNNGYAGVEYISTPEIDYQFSTYGPISDALGFLCVVDGHPWYVLTFPTVNKTWVYDTSTGYWFEWQSYHATTTWGRHRANCAVKFGRDWIIGDYNNGTLYILDMSVYTDDTQTIRRERTTPVIEKENTRLIFHELNIDIEPGVGTVTGQGEDPQIMLDWSNDGCKTWSNKYWKSMGKLGKYETQVTYTRLGSSRRRNFRLVISDPVKCVIIGANAKIEECAA